MLPDPIYAVKKSAKCIYTANQVEAALDCMAIEMEATIADTNPIFLCVVIGGIVTLGKLLPRLSFQLQVDYIHCTRYNGKTSGQDTLTWLAKPTCNLKDRTVVLVDDILDGGVTLSALKNYCNEQQADKVYTAVLVDKFTQREPGGLSQADFSGLKVPNEYVFGFGMDYKTYLRNARGIYAVSPEFID